MPPVEFDGPYSPSVSRSVSPSTHTKGRNHDMINIEFHWESRTNGLFENKPQLSSTESFSSETTFKKFKTHHKSLTEILLAGNPAWPGQKYLDLKLTFYDVHYGLGISRDDTSRELGWATLADLAQQLGYSRNEKNELRITVLTIVYVAAGPKGLPYDDTLQADEDLLTGKLKHRLKEATEWSEVVGEVKKPTLEAHSEEKMPRVRGKLNINGEVYFYREFLDYNGNDLPLKERKPGPRGVKISDVHFRGILEQLNQKPGEIRKQLFQKHGLKRQQELGFSKTHTGSDAGLSTDAPCASRSDLHDPQREKGPRIRFPVNPTESDSGPNDDKSNGAESASHNQRQQEESRNHTTHTESNPGPSNDRFLGSEGSENNPLCIVSDEEDGGEEAGVEKNRGHLAPRAPDIVASNNLLSGTGHVSETSSNNDHLESDRKRQIAMYRDGRGKPSEVPFRFVRKYEELCTWARDFFKIDASDEVRFEDSETQATIYQPQWDKGRYRDEEPRLSLNIFSKPRMGVRLQQQKHTASSNIPSRPNVRNNKSNTCKSSGRNHPTEGQAQATRPEDTGSFRSGLDRLGSEPDNNPRRDSPVASPAPDAKVANNSATSDLSSTIDGLINDMNEIEEEPHDEMPTTRQDANTARGQRPLGRLPRASNESARSLRNVVQSAQKKATAGKRFAATVEELPGESLGDGKAGKISRGKRRAEASAEGLFRKKTPIIKQEIPAYTARTNSRD